MKKVIHSERKTYLMEKNVLNQKVLNLKKFINGLF